MEDDKIDLLAIIKLLWTKRRKLIYFSVIAGVIGLIISIFTPNEYTCTSKMIPEYNSDAGGASSILQKYGGILGLGSVGGTSGGQGISPELYPKIVESTPFNLELINTPIYFKELDSKITIEEYFSKHYNPGLISNVARYTVKLPSTIKNRLRKSENKSLSDSSLTINVLSAEKVNMIEMMKSRVNLNSDVSTGVISVTCEMPDNFASAELSKLVVTMLEEYVTEYKTNKATEDMSFISGQLDAAKQNFEEQQRELARYQDSHFGIVTASGNLEMEQLKAKYNLAYNVFNSLLQQYEDAKISVQKNRPVFSELEPPVVPVDKSSPKRLQILVAFILIGLFLGTVQIFLVDLLKKIDW